MPEPREQPILILTGAPGSGKTTAAERLAVRSQRAVHIEADQFFRFIAAGYVAPWEPESHEQNTTVMHVVAGAAAGYARAGYFTIVDGIVSPQWFLDPLREQLSAAGCAVAYAVLRAPLATCLSRVAARESHELSDAHAIERLWRDFVDLGPLESHVIDVGMRTADEAVDALVERLDAGLLLVAGDP